MFPQNKTQTLPTKVFIIRSMTWSPNVRLQNRHPSYYPEERTTK
jgi:hypothetical protein